MGNALPCSSSNYQESVSSSQICNTALDETYSGHGRVTYDTVENVEKDAQSNTYIVTTDTHDSPVQEHLTITGTLSNSESHESEPCNGYFSEQGESLDQDELRSADVDSSNTTIVDLLLGTDSAVNQGASLKQNEMKTADVHGSILKNLRNAEVFKFSDELEVVPSVVDGIGFSSSGLHTESSTELSAPKLVSALKGTRALLGLPVIKLSLKWAPDVYDPPVTSESHTVKGHRHRRKLIKKDYGRQSHSKSKSLKSGVSEKKHSSRRNTSFVDPKVGRFGAAEPVKVYYSSALPSVQALDDISVEMKCGASYYKEPVSRVCFAVAEAS